MKKILLAIATIGLVSTPALARVHTTEERDSTIALCKVVGKADDATRKEVLAKLNASSMSAEDKDYVLDMCYSYNAGYNDAAA